MAIVGRWIPTCALGVLLAATSPACSSEDEVADAGADITGGQPGGAETVSPGAEVSGGTGADAGPIAPDGGWPLCTPGTLDKCSTDARSAIVCNETGDGYVSQTCKGDDGLTSFCNNDYGCLKCVPGRRRCRDDSQMEVCADGLKWVDDQNCHEGVTGQVCTEDLGNGAACVRLCELARKWNTYMGCEYWAADLDNAFVPGGSRGYYDAAGAQYAIVVSNPNAKDSATVEIFVNTGRVDYDSKQNPMDYSPIPPGGLRVFNLPRRDVNSTVVAPLAFRVVASIPITAYQFNPLENVGVFSNDASLLLPENVLGTEYVVMTREQTFETLRSFVTVIATQPGDTQVNVTVTAPTLPDNGIPHLEPGESLTVTMKQFDVLNIETNRPGSDLTGTRVVAQRRVAVFGGSEAANAPNTARCLVGPTGKDGVCEYDGETPCDTPLDCLEFNTCCADHLEHEMIPVRSWGKHYIATKAFPRGLERDVWRILAAEDNTKVTTVPPQPGVVIPVLHRGEWFEFETAMDFEVVASKPIMVGQFLPAQDAPEPNVNGIPQPGDAGTGDPAFILAVPFEQYREDYVFLAPNKYEFDYVNIVAPTGSEVSFDGASLDPGDFSPIGTGEFSVLRFLIEDGSHSVTSPDPIGIVVYGFDQFVSYGYPGGLDVRDLGFIKESTVK